MKSGTVLRSFGCSRPCRTRSFHLKQVFRKLDIGSRVELARMSAVHGANPYRAVPEDFPRDLENPCLPVQDRRDRRLELARRHSQRGGAWRNREIWNRNGDRNDEGALGKISIA